MCLRHKKIKIGKKYIRAVWVKLQDKNLILLRGARGYVMCGYLDLKTAERFKDTAIKIVGASTIEEAVKTTVHSCTSRAKKSGVYKGQPVKETLRIIA